jgi:glycosyltransferase involved in cell wall biosynthesis
MIGVGHALLAVRVAAWLVAGSWLARTVAAARGLPRIPDLLRSEFDREPEGRPRLTVVVPARNEGPHVLACLESLLGQDYAGIDVIAVDDRSTDDTGAVMDGLAVRHGERLRVIHVTELPAGWLGKTHALALGAREAGVMTQPDFLLFTDADVVFRPDALRRTLVYAVDSDADHMVTVPTMLVHRWDEGLVLGFFQIFGLWAARPWRVEEPKAMRDAVGVGAFNMLRRSAYLEIGGFEAQKMDILEDMTLARRVKRGGLRQRIGFARGMVTVHWARGARGLIEGMTKNIFSGFRFHASLLVGACVWLAVFGVGPGIGVWWAPTRVPSVIAISCVGWAYRLVGRHSGISAWNFVFFPVAAAVFIFTLLRSMAVTLWQGGVMWRGTFYSLEELRREAGPLW